MASSSSSSSASSQQSYDKNLYQKVKPVVWVIRVTGIMGRSQEVVKQYTAFAVRCDGVLITCAHIVHGLVDVKIEARRLDMTYFTGCSVKELNTNWDLCLLNAENVAGCNVANLATNGFIQEGEPLLCITNPQECVGSLGLHHAVFRCADNVTLPNYSGRKRGCLEYDDDTSTSMEVKPGYRIMGNVWNRHYLAGLKRSYLDKLHPLIPIIQCGDICAREGSVGGPIINTQGEVVGIIASHARRNQIAIHVTLIREFLKQALQS